MFFPIGTDHRLKHRPRVTIGLIGVNVAIFLLTVLLSTRQPDLLEAWLTRFQLSPAEQGRQWFQFFSYQFLHGGWMHLAFNMLFLYVFGCALEDRIGSIGFLCFYLAGGIVAGMAHTFIEAAPVIGASGSISAVTGAFLALFPLTRVRVLVIYFIITIIEISSMWLILFFFVKDVLLQVLGASGGVAYLAHIGGAVFGFTVGMALLGTRLLRREAFDFLALVDRWNRRRQFRTAARGGSGPWLHHANRAGGAPAADDTPPDPEQQRLLEQRAAISRAHRAGDLEQALDIYERLLADKPDQLLPRPVQMDLANYAMTHERHGTAARAYELLLKSRPDDPEQVEVRLMLGLIHTRYLPDPARARQYLQEVREAARAPERRQLAEQLLGELPDQSGAADPA